jgi:hypothetical protein
MAALMLVCAAVAPAAGPQPNADPLWKAYPLNSAPPATATTTSPSPYATTERPAPSADQPTTAPARPLDRPRSGGPSPAVMILFFGSLAAAAALAAASLVRWLRRRRAIGPQTCEITWLPVAEGGAFSATIWQNGDAPQVVAASRRFERRMPGPPDQDRDSRQAYAELVRRLISEGWEPYGRGHAWWEMRLRRSDESETPTEAIHG